MREFKHKARFTAVARCLLGEEAGKALSIASLADLKSILPVGAHNYSDLLPIAGNICVVNLGNGNGDMIDTSVGSVLFPQFEHKFINLEHDRSQIVGHLTTSNLSKFNLNYAVGAGSEILGVDDVKDSFAPFNIAVAGYVYKTAYPQIVEKILESNDPESPEYLSVAFSWELGFDEHKLFVGSGDRNDGEVIDDPEKIEAWGSYLKAKKGKGKTPDGKPLYRLISHAKKADGSIDLESVLGLGVALTLAPAGQVAGVITPEFQSHSSLANKKDDETEKNISTTENHCVSISIQKNMKVLKTLKDIASLNDESKAEYSFANVANVIEASIGDQIAEAITQKAKEHQAALEAEKQQATAAQKKADEALAEVAKVKEDLKAAQAKLEELKTAQEQATATQKFNERMAHFDEKYDLTDADRKALASRVKGLDDAAFTAFANEEFAVFAVAKVKKPKEEAKASTVAEDPKKVAEEALASAKDKGQPAVPNTPAGQTTLRDKYAAAFENGKGITFEIKK